MDKRIVSREAEQEVQKKRVCVKCFRITLIELLDFDNVYRLSGLLEDNSKTYIEVGCRFTEKHKPQVGGYIEEYDNGDVEYSTVQNFGTIAIDANNSEAAIEQEIQQKGLNAPWLTPADIDAALVSETFTVLPGGKAMVCELTLRNGFTVRGEYACVSKENFNEEIGQKIARENARNKV